MIMNNICLLKKVRKNILALSSLLIMVLALCACGKSEEDEYTGEDVAITSSWSFTQLESGGEVSKREDFKRVDESDLPVFTCSDGTNCEFKINGQGHKGVISEENGQYNIEFDDTEATMTGVIKGNKLSLENNKKSFKVTFVSE